MGNNRNDAFNMKLQTAGIPPNHGPDCDPPQAVVRFLNVTLADEAVLAMKTRGAHWNVHGAGFYDRYTLFGAQYKQLNDISEEISKRIRVLDGQPMGSYEEFLKNTRLEEQPGVIPDIMDLLTDHEAAIRYLREDAKKCSEVYEDEVTRDFLVDILSKHEKMAWMLRSFIEPELNGSES